VFTRSEALAVGYSPAKVRWLLETGTWLRLGRGIYAVRHADRTGSMPRDLDEAEPHRWAAAIVAARRRSNMPVWVAGRSARALYGLPERSRPGEPVRLICATADSRHHARNVGWVLSRATVPPRHTAEIAGLPVLSAARVVVDALRTERLDTALMVGDRALRVGLVSTSSLHGVIAEESGWPGIRTARIRLPLLDSRRESPLESGSAALFVEHNIPMPVPQYSILDEQGRLVARVDFAWPERRVVGEADGRIKYESDLPDALPADHRLWAERLRQDELTARGWEVVRWTDRERRLRPDQVSARILNAFKRTRALGLTDQT
jgi:hypothetical protein